MHVTCIRGLLCLHVGGGDEKLMAVHGCDTGWPADDMQDELALLIFTERRPYGRGK